MKSKPRCPEPCPERRPGCQDKCETYAEMKAYNAAAKAFLNKGRAGDALLISGYIKRREKARVKDKRYTGRYRGT